MTPLRARLILAVLAAVSLYGFGVQRAIAPPRPGGSQIGDTQLQLRTIERIRSGEDYYAAVGDELRKNSYPTSPVVNWRTPLHYRTVAALSVDRAGKVLFALCMAAVITAALVYSQQSPLVAVWAAVLLLASLAPAMLVRPGAVGFSEHWSAAFIALSLNAYVAKRYAAGAALGLVALFLRELAAPFVLLSALLAWHAGRRGEWRLWLIGALVYSIHYGLHAAAASAAIHPGDLVREQSYFRWMGLRFVFMTLYVNGIFSVLPPFATPIGTSAALAATCAESAIVHVKWSVLAYLAVFCIAGQPFNFYWGYLTAPIWAHALVHAPEGIWRLTRLALGRPAGTRTAVAGR